MKEQIPMSLGRPAPRPFRAAWPFPPRSFRSPLWPGIVGWQGGCKCCRRPLVLPFARVPWVCSWCFGRAGRALQARGEKLAVRPRRWSG